MTTTSDFNYPIDPTFPTTYGVTPSQTVGPYLHIGVQWDDGSDVVPPGTDGMITIVGTVYDGVGEPILDAMVETWQADPAGRFEHPLDGLAIPAVEEFRGFGRCDTRSGGYEIRTVKPGVVRGGDGGGADGDEPPQAPHIDVSVFARGMINRVVTRLYFPDEERANSADPLLASVPADRRSSLIAVPEGDALRFDVHVQGERETVFFEF